MALGTSTQTERREYIVDQLMAKYATDGTYSFVDMQLAVNEVVKTCQNLLAEKTDALANTLHSNENGGYAGRISELRKSAHALIDAADELIGTYRS